MIIMLIFFALLILWFVFFIYNKFDFAGFKDSLFLFYRINLSNLERANVILIIFDSIFLLIFIIYLIIKILEYKRTTKKIITKTIAKKTIASKTKTVKKIGKKKTIAKKKE